MVPSFKLVQNGSEQVRLWYDEASLVSSRLGLGLDRDREQYIYTYNRDKTSQQALITNRKTISWFKQARERWLICLLLRQSGQTCLVVRKPILLIMADEAARSILWSIEPNTDSKSIYVIQRASLYWEVTPGLKLHPNTQKLKPFGFCYMSI